MPSHVVAEGEHLAGICLQYGFADSGYVFNHPANAALKRRRPNPNQLLAGDVVQIPPVRAREERRPADATHHFTCSPPTIELHLVLRGAGGAALSSQPYTLSVGKLSLSGRTDGTGALRHRLPAWAADGVLRLDDIGLEVPVKVGQLDPHRNADDGAHVLSGVQARLRNLGFDCGEIDGRPGPKTSAAIAAFQRQAMGRDEPDGVLDDETLDTLASRHGC